MPLSRRVSFSPAAEWRGELLWIAITRPAINPSLTSLRRPRRYCWTVMILHISVPQAVFSQSLRRRHKTENTRCAGNVCELLISSLPGGFCSPVPCVCMCGCALLATAFMLHTGWFKIYAARPFWHWRELLQKQKKKKSNERVAALAMLLQRYTARPPLQHGHLGTVMWKRWCFMQTIPAESHPHRFRVCDSRQLAHCKPLYVCYKHDV